jgi:hypothetical protein
VTRHTIETGFFKTNVKLLRFEPTSSVSSSGGGAPCIPKIPTVQLVVSGGNSLPLPFNPAEGPTVDIGFEADWASELK